MTQYREHFTSEEWFGDYGVVVKLKEPTDERGFTPTVAVQVCKKGQLDESVRVHGKHFTRAWVNYMGDYGTFNEDELEDMVQSKLKSFAESIQANIVREKERQKTEQQRRDAFESGVKGVNLEQLAALGEKYDEIKDD